MELQILAKKDNPLLQRTEVSFKAIHKAEPTPTRDAIRQELAKHLKATKDVVVVDGARSTFGRYETAGYAKIYKSKDQALSVERYHILVRNKLAEPKAKEAKPGEAAPAPKAERPAPASKKEEAKPAPKPEPKAETKAEPKAHGKEEKKPAEKKDEHKPGHKPEHKLEPKAEGKKEPETKKEPKKKEGK